MIDPLLPEGKYFSMGEAARIVQIPDYTMRYWESRLRLLRPVRRESGHRRYTQQDLKLLLRVKELVHRRHMTLAGARAAILRENRGKRSERVQTGTDNGASTSPSPTAEKVLRELRADLKQILAELSE